MTGGIGSGKSTVSAMLQERGAIVVDADAITRELQEPGTPVFDRIVERFGDEVVGPAGELDRPALAAVVFDDAEALADLTGIVHPAVGEEVTRRLVEQSTTDHVVVLDIPLLVESGRTDTAGTIVVDVDEDLAVRRLVEHRGFEEADARARMRRQASREDRLAVADFVIDNRGTQQDLVDQVDRCWDWIQGL